MRVWESLHEGFGRAAGLERVSLEDHLPRYFCEWANSPWCGVAPGCSPAIIKAPTVTQPLTDKAMIRRPAVEEERAAGAQRRGHRCPDTLRLPAFRTTTTDLHCAHTRYAFQWHI